MEQCTVEMPSKYFNYNSSGVKKLVNQQFWFLRELRRYGIENLPIVDEFIYLGNRLTKEGKWGRIS